jgi:hypothetical protein
LPAKKGALKTMGAELLPNALFGLRHRMAERASTGSLNRRNQFVRQDYPSPGRLRRPTSPARGEVRRVRGTVS